ncbi:acyltransferase [Actinomadura barringtoniae]|uniref:Acyltransferase n=1 Tax=Actinomadura barringtoniae TaxID=1427535 RepID=A0A939P746_9ACTN|nr:acyltransferase [Actinomadura barringtoniae]
MDVLRGIAACAVAAHHAAGWFLPDLYRHTSRWFNLGIWGVLVFFLVSGYVIPASLEKTGSLRRFWIGRLFRIHPLVVVAVCGVGVLAVGNITASSARALSHAEPITAALAHGFLLQEMLNVPNAIVVMWTLSYEMVFYLLAAGLFAVGLHRRSAPIAVSLATVGFVLGAVVPAAFLSRHVGTVPVIAVAALLLAAAIAASVARPTGSLRTVGAVLGAVVALLLVTLNSRSGIGWSCALLAMMFTGTVLHRADQGRLRRSTAALTTAVVAVLAVVAGFWNSGVPAGVEKDYSTYPREWAIALVLAVAAFVAGRALSNRRMPGALAWLGTVSYSVYLIHPLLMAAMLAILPESQWGPAAFVAYFAILLPVSWLSYRIVEIPMQNLGRRLARRADPAPPSSSAAAPAEVPAPAPAERLEVL